MPIYEYVCDDCGQKFDSLRSMKDADQPIDCKKCGSSKTHRALSMCFSHSDGGALAGSGGGCNCGSCGGGSCSSCGH